MSDKHYDLIVVGGGSAGITATTMAARLGARVLLVDKSDLGGDCLHYGCVPSKALIASARLAHRMRHASRYGLKDTDIKVDVEAVMARIQTVKDAIGQHETPEVFREMGADVMLGGARFVDEKTIEIARCERITADKYLVATGSYAINPTIPGLDAAESINHVSVFHLRDLPRRLAVIGGGPMGCEIGQALSRLGSEVTIVQRRERLLMREDPDVSYCLQEALEAENIRLLLGTDPVEVNQDRGVKKVVCKQGSMVSEIECDQVFVAIGRRPSIDNLNLAAAGVGTNARGIVVDDTLRTSQKHIFAAGDCNGGPQFTHWAEYEARLATRNALFRGADKRSAKLLPWVTFTDPEVAHVGVTLEEARQHGISAHVHQMPYAKLDRAVCEGDSRGLIKVVVGEKEQILGAHIVGMQAGDVSTDASPTWFS